jgi:hypothetical protein
MLTYLRKGSRGPLVRKWQNFLLGAGHYIGEVDGSFGPATEEATKKYQRASYLNDDGVVGNRTWGVAMEGGFEVIEPDRENIEGPGWPPYPKDLKPANWRRRVTLFGEIPYTPAPTKNNPERVIIPSKWKKANLTDMVIPQLKGMGVAGLPKSCRILWNKKAKAQLLGLFQAWDDAGHICQINSWAGSWVPRFVRGSRTILSNHSWGTAFDINVAGNYLGRQPALVGEANCVRELVPLANKFGFYWGGHGWPPRYDRLDGMHFEVAKILTDREVEEALDCALALNTH